MLDRKEILKEAIDKCLIEMYEKSQPSVNLQEYIKQKEQGVLDESITPVHDRHYLSQNEFLYILNKYKEAYRCINEWKSNIDFLIQCFKEGGYRTIYKNDKSTAEQTPTLENLIGKENADKVIKLVEDLKDFYHFDRDEEILSVNVALGCSPTSNMKVVEDYWKSLGKNIKIDPKNYTEDEFWQIDMYGHLLNDEDDDKVI